jgi:hypothetical protein
MLVAELYERRLASGQGVSEVPYGVKALLDSARWGSYR